MKGARSEGLAERYLQAGGQGFESPWLHQVGHCTNTGHSAVGVFCARALWDADRNDPARPGDLDVSDQRLEERLALGVSARADDLVDVVGNLAERGGRRRRQVRR